MQHRRRYAVIGDTIALALQHSKDTGAQGSREKEDERQLIGLLQPSNAFMHACLMHCRASSAEDMPRMYQRNDNRIMKSGRNGKADVTYLKVLYILLDGQKRHVPPLIVPQGHMHLPAGSLIHADIHWSARALGCSNRPAGD